MPDSAYTLRLRKVDKLWHARNRAWAEFADAKGQKAKAKAWDKFTRARIAYEAVSMA